MTYSFGIRSHNKKITCHKDLQLILDKAIKIIDFSILEGARTLETQQKYFAEGKSKVDGVNVKSKHQVSHNQPLSLAVDIAPYPIYWDDSFKFAFLAGVMKSVATNLLEQNKITHQLRWGGDWNSNNNFKDQTFFDLSHFELVKFKYE